MRPKGTIYQAGKSGTHGEAIVALPKAARFSYNLLRGLGAGLIGFAVISALFTYGPIVKEEFLYNIRSVVPDEPKISTESLVNVAEADRVVAVQKEAYEQGVNSYFSVVIPKIDASSNVIANVDAGNEEEYLAALKEGVAHAKGTYFPGQERNIYLFAHSTDSPINISHYNAVFYLLRKLEAGDKVIVYFADDKYVFEVEDKAIVEAEDTSWLTRDYGGERLILQTCDPPGTTWKRLVVIAKPVN